jgi:hypothetical protein
MQEIELNLRLGGQPDLVTANRDTSIYKSSKRLEAHVGIEAGAGHNWPAARFNSMNSAMA